MRDADVTLETSQALKSKFVRLLQLMNILYMSLTLLVLTLVNVANMNLIARILTKSLPLYLFGAKYTHYDKTTRTFGAGRYAGRI